VKTEHAMMVGALGTAGIGGLAWYLKSKGGDKRLPVEIQLASVIQYVSTAWATSDEGATEWRMWNPASPETSDLTEIYDGDWVQLMMLADCTLTYGDFTQPLLLGANSFRWPGY